MHTVPFVYPIAFGNGSADESSALFVRFTYYQEKWDQKYSSLVGGVYFLGGRVLKLFFVPIIVGIRIQ